MKNTYLRAAAVLSAGLLGACAGPQYQVKTAPTVTVPGLVGAPLGKRSVGPDEPVMSVPVGYQRAARLADDVVVDIVDKKFAFASDETLPLARLSGQAAGDVAPGTVVFCGRPNSNLAKNMLAASTLGITSLFNRTSGMTRVCFFDAEADNVAEKAILVGVKSADDAAPVAISPLGYSIADGEPMSGQSEMRIVYRGKTGLVGGHVSFGLEVLEQGQQLVFSNVRRQVDIEDLPAQVTLMGAKFTVLSYDPASGAAQLDIHSAIPQGQYGLQTVQTTQYIPIYVPR